MPDALFDEHVTIKSNQKLNDHYYLLAFESEVFAKTIRPGQFLNLKLDAEDCFLRRPFSVYNIRGKDILILYMIVGRGTRFMASLKKGDAFDALGPLGNGFQIPEKGKEVFLLSGGTGIGSVYLLYAWLKKRGENKLIFATGFRNKDFFFDSLKDENVVTFTEDGSLGRKGYVTNILEEVAVNPSEKMVYACGPHGMLSAVRDRMRNLDCPTQLSLEESMACGVGACLGCVTETGQGRKTVCKTGPIFNLSDFESLKLI